MKKRLVHNIFGLLLYWQMNLMICFTSVGAKAFADSRAIVTTSNSQIILSTTQSEFCAEVEKFRFHPVSCDVVRKIVYSCPSESS